jgi:hypothetical protein
VEPDRRRLRCSTPTYRLILSHNSRSAQRFSKHRRLGPIEEKGMPKMSDSRRKRIQAKQRKATNAVQRAAKLAKRERNSAKPGKAAG